MHAYLDLAESKTGEDMDVEMMEEKRTFFGWIFLGGIY